MYRTFLLLMLIGFSSLAQSKKISLTAVGFKEFVVLETPEKSKRAIFNSVKKWAEYDIRNASKSNYSELKMNF